MRENYFNKSVAEPYRILFPLGTAYLLWGVLIWIPLLVFADSYPILEHRYLMLNGFSASFIAGFLMTAVPKFSQTKIAKLYEVAGFIIITIMGLICAYKALEQYTFIFSSLQALIIFVFLLTRIMKRKVNPPYSFVFIFVGLILWIISGIMSIFSDSEAYKILHYEGSIAAIILGVGSRLIPGILGHVEIVQTQRKKYENEKPFLFTVPLHFFALMAAFIGSYFIQDLVGAYLRTVIVFFIGIYYWKLTTFPKNKSALTWCIWTSCWLILCSFLLKSVWVSGFIHASHSFFLSGILLLTLLIATRVLQSHGPKNSSLEDSKVLYLITFLIILGGATRVSAFLLPEQYLRHLGYSSVMVAVATVIWSYRYLRFINTKK
jgi:uncharacterized protein involved in response to NO